MISMIKAVAIGVYPTPREGIRSAIFATIVMWLIAYLGAVLADDLECGSLGFKYGYTNPKGPRRTNCLQDARHMVNNLMRAEWSVWEIK